MTDDPNDRTTLSHSSGGSHSGESIGPYRLLDLLGEGGMGQVWLAEQTEPVRRRVALKVIKAGMDSKQVIARFEAERQALALMDHPAVSKVFEAGITPHGRPYFAMEYVKGEPITAACDRHRLDLRTRLELFRAVCAGVQHAHQKAILHRDLKPSNILLSEIDGKRVPKIIDFGLAKATTQKLTDATMYTQIGTLLGTPDYMSPEQADLTTEDIDTRTDVYSLGVVLYELLVGALPFDPKELRTGGIDHVREVLRERDPSQPSVRVQTLADAAGTLAKARRTDPAGHRQALKGDLDWIVMKALEKDRTRRYASAQEFSDDIRRFLRNEPVQARPASAAYRVRKFVRRHRIGVSVAAALTVSLLAGIVGTTLGLLRARAAEREAEQRAGFFADLLREMNPQAMGVSLRDDLTERGIDPTVLDRLNLVDVAQHVVNDGVLAEAGARIDEQLADDPMLAAQLHQSIGLAYQHGLTQHALAAASFRSALEHQRRAAPGGSALEAELIEDLAESLIGLGATVTRQEARELLEARIAQHADQVGPDHPALFRARTLLAEVLADMREVEASQAELESLLPLVRDSLSPDDPQLYRTIATMGYALNRLNQAPVEAEPLFQEAAEGLGRTLGSGHPETYQAKYNLARCLALQSRYDEFLTLTRALVEDTRRDLGEDVSLRLSSIDLLAQVLVHIGELDEARRLYEEGLRLASRGLEHEVDRAATVLRLSALFLRYYGPETARPWIELLPERLEHGRDPVFDRVYQASLVNLANVEAATGHSEAAFAALDRAVTAGFSRPNAIRDNDALTTLRGPRLESLIERAEANAAAD